MPCGGIYPGAPGMTVEEVENAAAEARERGCDWTCYVCQKPGALHFLEEFDAFIHARCAIIYLAKGLQQGDIEAEIIIKHGHEVCLDFNLEAPKVKPIDPSEGPEIDPDDPWDLGPEPDEFTIVEV